jgi:hypothetical protein
MEEASWTKNPTNSRKKKPEKSNLSYWNLPFSDFNVLLNMTTSMKPLALSSGQRPLKNSYMLLSAMKIVSCYGDKHMEGVDMSYANPISGVRVAFFTSQHCWFCEARERTVIARTSFLRFFPCLVLPILIYCSAYHIKFFHLHKDQKIDTACTRADSQKQIWENLFIKAWNVKQ